ncbi:MAG: hypothetical protein ACYDEQ_14800, partial [Desulfocucumaceae bacterium]
TGGGELTGMTVFSSGNPYRDDSLIEGMAQEETAGEAGGGGSGEWFLVTVVNGENSGQVGDIIEKHGGTV